MRLADFLECEREAILAEWDEFARMQLPAATGMSSLALRDHAPQILEAIGRDLRTAQSHEAQHLKSLGRAPSVAGAPETAAQTHAVLRARHAFDVSQLVAEYRALRASVLRLWSAAAGEAPDAFEDMTRFNEAVDQAVAESVAFFQAEVDGARDLLLGMLGHDMRSPLATVITTASYLSLLDAGPQVSSAAERLLRSGHSLKALVDDLLDFSRTRLGLGLKVEPVAVDLASVVMNEVEQLRGAHPDRAIDLEITGDGHGHWDGARVQQLLRNLVSNAMRYGAPEEPVRVTVSGTPSDVFLAVSNKGKEIEAAARADLFGALKRGSEQGDGLGLGLFIVSAITEAHGGDIDVRSERGETLFRVRLPRVAVPH